MRYLQRLAIRDQVCRDVLSEGQLTAKEAVCVVHDLLTNSNLSLLAHRGETVLSLLRLQQDSLCLRGLRHRNRALAQVLRHPLTRHHLAACG